MLVSSKILHQNNKFVRKYLQEVRYRSSAQNFTRSFFFYDFFLNTRSTWECLLFIFFRLFFWLRCIKQESALFVSSKNQTVCTFFLANWLLLIDKFAKRNSCGYFFRRLGKFSRKRLKWSSQQSCSLQTLGLLILPD